MENNFMTWFRKLWKKDAQLPLAEPAPKVTLAPLPEGRVSTLEVDIPPTDPLLAYILSSPGVIEVDRLNLDSPTLRELKVANVRLSVPLISQGELIRSEEH